MSPSPSHGPPAPETSPKRVRVRRWRRMRAHLRLFRRRMHAHPVLHLPWRIGVGVVGTLVILAGTVMLVTPGPGAAGIILGLLILSTEFGWAHRLLRPTRRWFRIAEKHGERFKNDLLRRYRKRRTTGAKPSAAE